jgi:aromatic ring-opening dioxygenase catalytic subunit (LigB family)
MLPTYFISHGGGPWPWLREEMPGVYDRLEASLKEMPRELGEAVCEASPAERNRNLLEWSRAPSARVAHPREDHLIPLMVAAGAADGEPCARVYHEDSFFGGLSVSSFRFGTPGS